MESIYAIILVNVLVFVGVNIHPAFLDTMALFPYEVWSHPWQIVTSMFTHYSFTHILFNMWAFYFFGSAVLRIMGVKRFWLIYMVGGLLGGIVYVLFSYLGSATSFTWLGNTYSGAIGASGAIFALQGALAVLRPNMRIILFPIPVPMPLWVAVVGSFIVLSFIAGIAWPAHLGGLAFGALAGWLYRRNSFSEYRWN